MRLIKNKYVPFLAHADAGRVCAYMRNLYSYKGSGIFFSRRNGYMFFIA